MHLKIFTGAPETLQAEVTQWMQQHRHRISHVLQSQSTTEGGQALLTITLFYEEANTGTGLGFRRSIE
jgi:multidrug efflux pump subunit AcrB